MVLPKDNKLSKFVSSLVLLQPQVKLLPLRFQLKMEQQLVNLNTIEFNAPKSDCNYGMLVQLAVTILP